MCKKTTVNNIFKKESELTKDSHWKEELQGCIIYKRTLAWLSQQVKDCQESLELCYIYIYFLFFLLLFPQYNFFSTEQHGDPITHTCILFSPSIMLRHKYVIFDFHLLWLLETQSHRRNKDLLPLSLDSSKPACHHLCHSSRKQKGSEGVMPIFLKQK